MRAFALTVLALALPALANGEEARSVDGLDGLYGCTSIAAEAERLACLDAAVSALRQAQERGEIAIITKQEVEADAEEKFGLRGVPSVVEEKEQALKAADTPASVATTDLLEAEAPSERIFAVASFDETLRGKLRVRLENGAVWEQTDSRKLRLSKRSPPETVEIREASLGSFMMVIGNYPAIRVKRVE